MVLIVGFLGMVIYFVVNGISWVFWLVGLGEVMLGVQVRQVVGKVGCVLFLYLEVFDVVFFFDGVIGVFVIIMDLIIIVFGFGVVGVMFVWLIMIYLV